MIDEEVWAISPIRSDRYDISNHGRVRSRQTDGSYRILRPYVVPGRGYSQINMIIGGTNHTVFVHRLVALAFVPGEGPLVRHLDDNPGNNRSSNLAWGDQADNYEDMRHNKGVYGLKKTHCKSGHAFSDENTWWDKEGHRNCRQCRKAWQAKYKAAKTS